MNIENYNHVARIYCDINYVTSSREHTYISTVKSLIQISSVLCADLMQLQRFCRIIDRLNIKTAINRDKGKSEILLGVDIKIILDIWKNLFYAKLKKNFWKQN